MSGWGNQGQGQGFGHGHGHGHGHGQGNGQWGQQQGGQWGQGQQGQQWGQQGQQGQWGQQGQIGGQQWGQQGQQGGQQWGQQGQQGGQQWGQQGDQWGQQGQQGQQWGQQGQQGQWGQQGQQQQGGWGQQGQQWGGFQPVEGQLYKFVCALNPQFVLDVSQNPNDFNKLILWPDNNGANQKFILKSVGGGKYGIFCAKNGLTVELPDANKGSRVQCSQPNKQPNEFWELVPVNNPKFQGKNAYHLKSFGGHAMDVEGNNAHNESRILTWDLHGGDNQTWFITPTN